MQVATGRRRWVVVLAALTIVLLGGAVTSAQASDPIVRFFGFSGDVTIDGEPVEAGAEIAAMVGDQEVGRTTVNQAGAWILDVNSEDLSGDPCLVTFVVDGLRAPEGWDCGELRLRLSLYSNGQSRDSSTTPDSQADADSDDAESSEPDDDTAQDGSQTAAGAEDDNESAEQAQEIVRPTAPRTGTGGMLDAENTTNWPRAAAITALLTCGIAVMALLMSRRTNSAE